jgi:crossover junction endodeoxyribonuclease RuvC
VRVLGIDPGFATTGYGVVERIAGSFRAVTIGVVRTPPALPQADRLAHRAGARRGVIHATEPDVVAVERLFFNSNVRTAMSVGQASGVALLAAAEAGLHVVDYTPSEVKLSVVGVGNAAKQQVQSMVAALLQLSAVPKPADAADACALAICHLNRSGLSRAIATARKRAG